MTLLSVAAESSITRRAQREGWRSRPAKRRGGGHEWLVASMPETTRVAIQIAEAKACAAQLEKRQAAEARREELLQHRARAMATLTAKERARAEAKATVYRAWLDYEKECGLGRTEALASFCAIYNNGGAGLAVTGDVLAVVRHVSPNTIRSIGQRLMEDGLGGLAGVYGRHRVGTGRIDAQPEVREFVLGAIYEFPHIKVLGRDGLHAAVQARFRGRQDIAVPAARTLQLWLQRWKDENKQVWQRVNDPDAYRSRYQFAMGTSAHHVDRPNFRWEMDSTPGDLLLADGKRHTIVGCIDVYGRMPKLLVSRSSSAAAVCSLLHRCLLDWGVPDGDDGVVTDNGSDYVSARMETTLTALDIIHTTAPPFTPQHKPHIERFFRTMLHGIVELLPGYSGHNVAQAQAIRNRVSFAQRLYPKRGENAGTVELRLTPEQLQETLDRWCEDVYAMSPHPSLDGRTPYEVYAAWDGPITRIADEAALAVLLLPLADGDGGWRTVLKKGVHVGGHQYIHAALGEYAGQRVLVRMDEADIRYAYIFAGDERTYICRAMDAKLPEASIADVARGTKRVQANYVKEKTAEMRKAARKMNVRTMPQEILTAAAEHAAEVRAQAVQPATPSVLYTTPALMEAGKAARAGDAPVVDMNESQQADMALGARIAAQAQRPKRFQDRLAELGPAERWKEWELLDARKKAGGTLTPDEASWHAMYPTGSEGLGFWITKHGLPEHMRRRVHG
ncbi:Mu transposase C-terminal domain-containing protein [Nitratidesulfovibrio liaohensis]|uniref:Mu transposase C-terminal domain-containing protein n=1 Tax=Nitratidesulfovibrio liaohensis TaxID=2604158 RepID=A0ABY9R7F4_9BACT|nr:Mu transposase C-terminal domain-containing protein [Nitratidesulfovibrio liaohensis]WMW66629.1 Mu transposase C-terminal domain-containing protein [Nitratidesulfovibrio liaohensis]